MRNALPTRLDRYPAKMVSNLAEKLVDRYASDSQSLLDPFAGSCAILRAAQRRGVPVAGIDLNPIAALFAKVKLGGFDREKALRLWKEIADVARSGAYTLPIMWEAKEYWFTEGTIDKYEFIRGALSKLKLRESKELTAILLCLNLSVRLCSRADQRSPKPFISKTARSTRTGRHYDPYFQVERLIGEIAPYYSLKDLRASHKFLRADLSKPQDLSSRLGFHSHVITSPPYINAQDYFRNFKLELHVMEGVLPFEVSKIRNRFIGTERVSLVSGRNELAINELKVLNPHLREIESRSERHAVIVHRYFADMRTALNNITGCMQPHGTLVLVCGDNLIAGHRIKTWEILEKMITGMGFTLFDSFADPIKDRLLAPMRSGHKGLIKEEVILAFHKEVTN